MRTLQQSPKLRAVFQGVPALLQTMVSCPECLTEQQIQAITDAIANCKIPEITTSTPRPIPKPKLVKRQNHTN